MPDLCTWATIHLMRFAAVETLAAHDLTKSPAGAASWQIGFDGPTGPDGTRQPSEVWCAIGLYRDESAASRAIENPDAFLPFLDQTSESWHGLILPITHRGEFNHLERDAAGLVFQPATGDPGGPLLVVTTAGYVLDPPPPAERIFEFRREVDAVRHTIAAMPGNLCVQLFTPVNPGYDGCTMTLWRDEAAMSAFAYAPGRHRDAIGRQISERLADRTSFTRFRILRSHGHWEGCNPADGLSG